MQALNIVKRISKILGKVVLGLLILLILVVGIIHLPPVQKHITEKLSNYLSSKIEANVDIERIRFSLLGNVTIHNLAVSDPQNAKILSALEIEVRASVFDLLRGNLIFDEIRCIPDMKSNLRGRMKATKSSPASPMAL
jgi:autotransporter translocation and assembly factor TamB